eukprot:3565986-Rhodomonas_salina.2
MARVMRVLAVASASMAVASGFMINAPGPALLGARRISGGMSAGVRKSTMLLGSPNKKGGALTVVKSSGPAPGD